MNKIKRYFNSLFLLELMKGLYLTGRHMFRKKITYDFFLVITDPWIQPVSDSQSFIFIGFSLIYIYIHIYTNIDI